MTAIITDVHYRMAVALIRDLGEAGIRVIACESEEFSQPMGFCSRYVSRCVVLPKKNTIDALYQLCQEIADSEGDKPSLLPVGAHTLGILAKQHERFQAVCGLCIPTTEQLDLFNDKAAVAQLAQSLDVSVPQSWQKQAGETLDAFAARIPMPCVVKPVCGEKFGLHAEARYAIVHTAKECVRWYEHFSAVTGTQPIVQEYLSGGGMGCSVLAKDGKIVCHICHQRIREYPVSGGPSSCCQVIENDTMLDTAQKLVAKTSYTGLAMFEFKLDRNNQPRLLEINPRIWGTYPLTRVSQSGFTVLWDALSRGSALPKVQPPKPVRMAFYPSDQAAMLGYLRTRQAGKFFAGLGDMLNPAVKSGLSDAHDRAPARAYWRSLRKRSQSKGN